MKNFLRIYFLSCTHMGHLLFPFIQLEPSASHVPCTCVSPRHFGGPEFCTWIFFLQTQLSVHVFFNPRDIWPTRVKGKFGQLFFTHVYTLDTLHPRGSPRVPISSKRILFPSKNATHLPEQNVNWRICATWPCFLVIFTLQWINCTWPNALEEANMHKDTKKQIIGPWIWASGMTEKEKTLVNEIQFNCLQVNLEFVPLQMTPGEGHTRDTHFIGYKFTLIADLIVSLFS